MEKAPKGYIRQFSDEELRSDLAEGLKPAEIAEKRSVSRAAVYKRVNQLELTTTSAAVAPVESQRFVNRQLDALEELAASFTRVRLLQEACDAWLRDARDPSRYDIGARGDEVLVTYWERGDEDEMVKAKATLQELIARVEKHGLLTMRSETRHADPRALILQTAQEVRQTVALGVELAQMLADARAMQTFREALLAEISKVSPDVAEKIADAVRRSLVFHAITAGPDALAG